MQISFHQLIKVNQEQDVLLSQKKKAFLKGLNLKREKSLVKLMNLVGLLFLHQRAEEIIAIGDEMSKIKEEDPFKSGYHTAIRTIYIDQLNKFEPDNKKIAGQKNILRESISKNLLTGEGLPFDDLEFLYPSLSREQKGFFHLSFIYEAMMLLHLGPPTECKYTKEELGSLVNENVKKAKELFKIK